MVSYVLLRPRLADPPGQYTRPLLQQEEAGPEMVLVWAGVLTQSTVLASCCFPTTRDEATYTRQALALASNPDCASSSSDSPARAWHIQDRTSGFHWGVRAAAGLVTVAVTDGPCAQASLCAVLESIEVSHRARLA